MKSESEEEANLSVLSELAIQTLFTEKHPVETLTPEAKVLVAVPVTAKEVVVAAEEVLFRAVKFWRVVDPV